MAVAGTYVYDNVDRDGSVTDFRSGWITLDHNAVAVVESGPAAGPNSPQLLLGVSSVPAEGSGVPKCPKFLTLSNVWDTLVLMMGGSDAQSAAQMMQRWAPPADPS